MKIKKKNIVGLGSLFISAIAIAGFFTHSFEFSYTGIKEQEVGRIQNAGFTLNLFPGKDYKPLDILYATWSNDMSSLWYHNGTASSDQWNLVAAWPTGGTPPGEACERSSEVPGCEGGGGSVVITIETCPDGPDPDAAAFGEVGEEECAEPDPSPILLDLDRNQFHLSGGPVLFDIDADGQIETITWVAPATQDAFLFLDRNGNGVVDDGSELFGNATSLISGDQAEHGYEALAEFDLVENAGNQDGVIDDADWIFSSLGVWIDSNANGIHESFESQSLAEAGVLSIGLDYRESRRTDSHGNEFRYIGSGSIEVNGESKNMATTDVFFKILAE